MKIFQREQRSLFGEILDWMLTPLLLLWPVSLALTWLVAQSIAGKPFDRALEYNVQALGQLVERLCEWGEEVSNNAIEVYIHRLRKKIEKGPVRIATVRGLGYCLEKIPG